MLPDCQIWKRFVSVWGLKIFILLCKGKFHVFYLDTRELSHYLKLPSFLAFFFSSFSEKCTTWIKSDSKCDETLASPGNLESVLDYVLSAPQLPGALRQCEGQWIAGPRSLPHPTLPFTCRWPQVPSACLGFRLLTCKKGVTRTVPAESQNCWEWICVFIHVMSLGPCPLLFIQYLGLCEIEYVCLSYSLFAISFTYSVLVLGSDNKKRRWNIYLYVHVDTI